MLIDSQQHQQQVRRPFSTTPKAFLRQAPSTTTLATNPLWRSPQASTPPISLNTALFYSNGDSVIADKNIFAPTNEVILIEDDDKTEEIQNDYRCLQYGEGKTRPSSSSLCDTMDCKFTPTIYPESTALVIVDVQPEYWSECDYSTIKDEFPNFPENIQRTIEVCRSCGIKIIWIRADYKYQYSPWLFQYRELRLNPKQQQNQQGRRFEVEFDADHLKWEDFAIPIQYDDTQKDKELMNDKIMDNTSIGQQQDTEVIIPKTSWSGTQNTPLLNILQMYGIRTVLLCGLLTSVCVQQTAFGVFEAGYETVLVEDACGDRGIARHNAALLLYADYMYKTITSTKLQNMISLQLKQQQQQKEDAAVGNKENDIYVSVNYDEHDGTTKPPPWGVTPTLVGVGANYPHRRRSLVSSIPYSTKGSRERTLAI